MPMKDVEWTHPRKEQKCIGCGETIPAGVCCQTLLQKDAKKISRRYLCERCAYAATNKVMASGGEGNQTEEHSPMPPRVDASDIPDTPF